MSVIVYDAAIIGAGPAGCMAAIQAARTGKRVILFERNDCLGKKIMLTGGGKCNFTNTAPIDGFLSRIKPNGKFFRTALFKFSNNDLIDFFKTKGLESIEEDNGRVLPFTRKSISIIDILRVYLNENKINISFNNRVVSLRNFDNKFHIIVENGETVAVKKVVIATGGISYSATGSTGDGFTIAKQLGHNVTNLNPGLVPLIVKESYIKGLQGLSFTQTRLTLQYGGKKKIFGPGEILFTHFGLSGPLVLDMSNAAAELLIDYDELNLFIDFKPDMTKDQLEESIISKIIHHGNSHTDSLADEFLPKRMVSIALSRLRINPEKNINQLTKTERSAVCQAIKQFSLTIIGCLSADAAMITVGGVAVKEIDPRTMESKRVPGLYFAGEIIEGAGISGGYNLQLAFSTGYLAGVSITADPS